MLHCFHSYCHPQAPSRSCSRPNGTIQSTATRRGVLRRTGEHLMSFTSRLVSRLMHLPPAQSHDIAMTRDIPIPMPDGVVLLADHYAPRGGSKLPTLLVRSPYGRKGFFSALTALPYAERGPQVLIQSLRGTAGSRGQLFYARPESRGGMGTITPTKQEGGFSG